MIQISRWKLWQVETDILVIKWKGASIDQQFFSPPVPHCSFFWLGFPNIRDQEQPFDLNSKYNFPERK